ncbi:hypothetical protein G3O08_17915 [Cryomorpha ignava]|uniref:Uncharacterized protein n=1 Tax=Cryomorpha ignava TaxID=101383 RepID=A0A7K3WV62_9FLAO|nr:hypothetical protein [Cryomorpha ignava]NEN25376.1 hypothetical protein [Cryomorpha ignava]
MNLDRLYENGLLSRRGMNVCLANNLLSLDAIKAYHKRRSTFQNLNSCGEKLNAELMALTNKHDETTAILPSDPRRLALKN